MKKLYPEHILLDTKGLGVCQAMTGRVEVLAVFVDLPDAPWTEKDMKRRQEVLQQALVKLEKEAAGYGAALKLSLDVYRSRAGKLLQVTDDNHEEWIEQVILATQPEEKPVKTGAAAPKKDMSWRDAFLGRTAAPAKPVKPADSAAPAAKPLPDYRSGLRGYFGRPLLMLQNKPGRAWAMSCNGGRPETAFIYHNDPECVLRHELLHLFGAADFYHVPQLVAAVKKHMPNSIMLDGNKSSNRVDEVTAYLVGWLKEPTALVRTFLKETAHLTREDERRGHAALDAR